MSSPIGLMASSINNNTVQGENFLPGHIFVFGGFALRANSLGHLEQIESYAPGHQVRFGSLNYTADIRGDLIFDEFEPQPGAPHCLDGYDLALPPDGTPDAAPTPAPTLSSEPTAPIEDRWLDAASGLQFLRRSSRTPVLSFAKLVTPRRRTPLRTPNLPRPCQSNPIGRQSWSSPPQTSFSTRPSATF